MRELMSSTGHKSNDCFLQNFVPKNFNGSNIFGTMKICSTQGYFELMGVNHSGRSGGIE